MLGEAVLGDAGTALELAGSAETVGTGGTSGAGVGATVFGGEGVAGCADWVGASTGGPSLPLLGAPLRVTTKAVAPRPTAKTAAATATAVLRPPLVASVGVGSWSGTPPNEGLGVGTPAPPGTVIALP